MVEHNFQTMMDSQNIFEIGENRNRSKQRRCNRGPFQEDFDPFGPTWGIVERESWDDVERAGVA